MDSYIEIRLLPDFELDGNFLLNSLCSKLHVVLSNAGAGRIGLSFPEFKLYGRSLGQKVRLHGHAADLQKLMAANWLQGLRDYCHCSEIATVPANARQCYFARIQQKSAENKRRRSVKKGWLTEEQALSQIPENGQKQLRLPYLQLKSRTTQQQLMVFIEQGPVTDLQVIGTFNSYGLSRSSEKVTVPWF
mgnify:CR=1 FL=1